MKLTKVMICGFGLALSGATPTMAQEERAKPQVFSDVLKCRDIVEPEMRLACFDKSVAEMSAAEETEDLLVVSREDVRKEKRGLFGLQLPRIGLFSSKDGDDEDEIKEITGTIASTRESRTGYIFKLEDGSVWYQTDSRYINTPKSGYSITIKNAALGSFLASINGGISVRVKRQQ